MTFGNALELLKKGNRVARAGWNGKGMWLTLLRSGGEINSSFDRLEDCIGMYTAQGTMQPGWLASQPDMLSDDWELVE